MTHDRLLRGRDAIAAVLESRLGLDAETARERSNNIATALGGCEPGDEIAEGIAQALREHVRLGVSATWVAVVVLAAWAVSERAPGAGEGR